MNFKNIGFGLAATATLIAGAGLAASPVNALTIGGKANFSPLTGQPTVLSVSNEFTDLNLTGGFTNLTGLQVNTIQLNPGSTDPDPLYNANFGSTFNFISSFQYAGQAARINLAGSQQVILTQGGTEINGFASTINVIFQGIIEALDGTDLGTVVGNFSGNQTVKNSQTLASNFSLDLTATPVPTPALLPGAVAMGVAALRKKRKQQEEDAELASEPVEV